MWLTRRDCKKRRQNIGAVSPRCWMNEGVKATTIFLPNHLVNSLLKSHLYSGKLLRRTERLVGRSKIIAESNKIFLAQNRLWTKVLCSCKTELFTTWHRDCCHQDSKFYCFETKMSSESIEQTKEQRGTINNYPDRETDSEQRWLFEEDSWPVFSPERWWIVPSREFVESYTLLSGFFNLGAAGVEKPFPKVI